MKRKTWIKAAAIIGIIFFFNALPLSGASARDIVKIEMWSSPIGVPAYQASLALSEMLKAKHPWLRLSPIQGRAFTNVNDQMALSSERRKYCMINSLTSNEYARARLGLKPWPRKMTDLMVVNVESTNGLSLATYDPDIKTPKDLIGKKVGLFPKVASPNALIVALMRDAWGILDKVKISYHRPMALKDMLVTGTVDAVYSLNVMPLSGGKWGQAPFSANVLGARKTYWINVTPEDIAIVNKKNPWDADLLMVPKDALGPGSPPKDTGLISLVMGMIAWQDMPEDVVYELIKFVDENSGEWSKRLRGFRMDHDSIIAWPGLTKDMVHAGALKYYKEKGIKVGK
jgi:TRAP-type uncharacterized transport system substrate-binding protein